MEFRIKNFIIRSSRDTVHYDLYREKEFIGGKSKGEKYLENTAWSIPISRCIQHIIADGLDRGDISDANEFLKEYQRISNSVLVDIKNLTKDL